MEQLSLILWRERELLDALLYRLEVEQLVLASGRPRWVAHAAQDVEAVLVPLRETELMRAVAADEAAASVGLDPDPPLRLLAERAQEPWREVLLEHREAFLALAREIAEVADTNRGLLAAGYRAARKALLTIGVTDGVPTRTAPGSSPRPDGGRAGG